MKIAKGMNASDMALPVCHSVGFFTIRFSVWILSINVGYFIIRKLFDISCISDHVQPISNHSVVLVECDQFVVTWSVQEYSCGHLVCAGIFLHSPVLLCGHLVCAGIFLHCPVFTHVCAGICLQSQNSLIYVHAHA